MDEDWEDSCCDPSMLLPMKENWLREDVDFFSKACGDNTPEPPRELASVNFRNSSHWA